MKKFVLLITLFGTLLSAAAQNSSVKERTETYINNYKELAIQEMIHYILLNLI